LVAEFGEFVEGGEGGYGEDEEEALAWRGLVWGMVGER
jgi:hypothetical protein